MAVKGEPHEEIGRRATMFAVTGSGSLVVGLLGLFLTIVAWKRVVPGELATRL